MFSTLVLVHHGPQTDEGSEISYIVDPSLQESQDLSNNLIMVTYVQKRGSEGQQESMDVDEDDGWAGA